MDCLLACLVDLLVVCLVVGLFVTYFIVWFNDLLVIDVLISWLALCIDWLVGCLIGWFECLWLIG